MNNELYFSEFNIVRCKEFELLQDDFLYKMSRLITNNYEGYNVSYDSNNDTYSVVYNYNRYTVRFSNKFINNGNDNKIKNNLDTLVRLSKFQRELHDEVSKKKNIEEEKKKKLYEKVRYNVARTVEEKEAEIELLKKDYRNDATPVFANTFDTLRDINEGDPNDLEFLRTILGVIGGLALGVMTIMALIGEAVMPVWAFIAAGFTTLDFILYIVSDNIDLEYRGLYATIYSIIASPFILGFNTAKRLVEKIKLLIKIIPKRRDIKMLKTGKKQKKVKNNNLNDILKTTKKDKKEKVNNVVVSFKEFNDIKNNILLIKDSKKKKELADELYKVLEYCIKFSNTSTSFKNKTYELLLEQLSALKEKVDNELKEDNQTEVDNRTYYKLMSEIKEKKGEPIEEESFQKRIGARK